MPEQPRLKKIPIEEATYQQLLEYADLENLELSPNERRSRDKIAARLQVSGAAAGGITVFNSDSQLGFKPGEKIEWDENREKWVRIRIQLDQGESKDAPVFCQVNDDTVYVPRGKDVVVRQRFVRMLQNSIEERVNQRFNSKGLVDKEVGDERVQVERYPHSIHSFHGFVDEGPPTGVPEGCVVISPA